MEDMLRNRIPFPQALKVLEEFLKMTEQRKKLRTTGACVINKILTEDEELGFVHICNLLAATGRGVSQDEAVSMIEDIIQTSLDPRQKRELSLQTVRAIMQNHRELFGCIRSKSICPKRALQATKDTRDKVFVKLEAFIQILYSAGKIRWKSFSEIPAHCIYNMDEIGQDTTRFRNKILGKKGGTYPVWTITVEGDGRMKKHITVCLTTRGDGKAPVDC